MRLFKKKSKDLPNRRSNISLEEITNTRNHLFKRNRTLTGTTSNQLNTVYAKSDLESSRTHVRHLSIQRKKVSIVLLFVILMSVPIWLIVSNFTASVVITSIDVSIKKPINKNKYERLIQDYLNTNPMSRFSFLLDTKSMNDFITNKAPEVSNVTPRNMVGLGKNNFVIKMREPVAGWKIKDKQYYVDSYGIPFEINYFEQPVVQISDNSGVSLHTSSMAIVSNRFLGFVGRVVHQSKLSGYTVTEANIPAGTTRELEVRLKEGNYLAKLSIDRSAGEQVEDMIAAVRFFASRNQVPAYIDVRVSGKAFYK